MVDAVSPQARQMIPMCIAEAFEAPFRSRSPGHVFPQRTYWQASDKDLCGLK